MIKSRAFTLTEVLLAVAIVGVISAIILPVAISKFNEKTLDLGFAREVKTISMAIDSLAVSENKNDFFSTMMYTDVEPDSYDDTSGKFIKKYLRVAKYCGDTNSDCFADKYYEYKDNKKEEYTPTYKGGCARLKNGMSICITPQIGARSIEGLLDINGKKGPNVFGRDLRSFTIDAKTRTGRVSGSTEVLAHNGYIDLGGGATSPNPPESPKSACEIDQNSLDCCRTRTITDYNDACCTYDEMKGMPLCRKKTHVIITCNLADYYTYESSKHGVPYTTYSASISCGVQPSDYDFMLECSSYQWYQLPKQVPHNTCLDAITGSRTRIFFKNKDGVIDSNCIQDAKDLYCSLDKTCVAQKTFSCDVQE